MSRLLSAVLCMLPGATLAQDDFSEEIANAVVMSYAAGQCAAMTSQGNFVGSSDADTPEAIFLYQYWSNQAESVGFTITEYVSYCGEVKDFFDPLYEAVMGL